MSAAGLALASLSVLIGIGSFIRSLFNPVLLYFDPLLQSFVGIGLLASFLALLFSIIGVWRPNPVRWHALAVSAVILFLWFGAAMSM